MEGQQSHLSSQWADPLCMPQHLGSLRGPTEHSSAAWEGRWKRQVLLLQTPASGSEKPSVHMGSHGKTPDWLHLKTSGPEHILSQLPSVAHSEHATRSHRSCTLEHIFQVRETSKLEPWMVKEVDAQTTDPRAGLADQWWWVLLPLLLPDTRREDGSHQEQQGTFVSRRHH